MRFAWSGLVCAAILAGACGGAGPRPDEPASVGSVPSTAPAAARCERRQPGIGALPIAHGDRQGRPVALARSGSTTLAYAADEDGDALLTFDVDSGAPRATTPLAGAPAQVLVLGDGRVAVTLRDANRVQILEPGARADQPLTPLCSVATPAEPVGLAATPDDATLLVTSAWARRLTAYDSASLEERYSRKLEREPRSVLVADDGRRAFVSHVVGGTVSVVDLDPELRDVRSIDLRVPKTRPSHSGSGLRSSCQGFALAKSIAIPSDEKPPIDLDTTPPPIPQGRVFAPRVTIDPGEPSRRSSGYGDGGVAQVESPIVTVIDADAERPLTGALLPPTATPRPNQGSSGACLLPRSAALSAASGGLLVACAGNDTLVELDPRGNDPSRLERRRWKVPSGPMGVAADDAHHRAVVWSQFDRELAVIDLDSPRPERAVLLVAAPRGLKSKLSPRAELGRRIFYKTDDPRISQDGRACASCHPDGREDQLTWSTPVGPRQTIMLAGRVRDTGPFSWLGVHESLEVHLESTFARLGGRGLPKQGEELEALVAYLEEMPAPSLAGAALDREHAQLAARGKALFFDEQTGCASCHVGSRGTDARKHDIGTQAAGDTDTAFDTPSLRFVAGTAPYFHDGRYATLIDALMATDSRMGHSMHLSRADAQALAAYLETL